MTLISFISGLLFLCWGSFLNVVACRVIAQRTLMGRSYCPHCHKTLAWYDLIPVVSWLMLAGRCRSCKTSITLLYPFIELLTLGIGLALIAIIKPSFWLGYGIFFSALIVTIRTDFEHMLISRAMTLGLIPVGILLSFFNKLPISAADSIVGALCGYGVLWLAATLFYRIQKIEGMGQGDLDLLAMIGSFTGLFGIWWTLFIGSLLGTIAGLLVMISKRTLRAKIAFGPWLAFGAMLYVFYQSLF